MNEKQAKKVIETMRQLSAAREAEYNIRQQIDKVAKSDYLSDAVDVANMYGNDKMMEVIKDAIKAAVLSVLNDARKAKQTEIAEWELKLKEL